MLSMERATTAGFCVDEALAGAGAGSAVRAAGGAGMFAFGVDCAAAGFGADRGIAPALGAGGMTVTGFAWTGGATGAFGGAAGAALAAGAAACFGPGAGAAGFTFAAGGGPNVMRGRNGSAETLGSDTGRS